MVSIRARGFVATETWLDRLTRITPFFLLVVPILPYTLTQHPAAGTSGARWPSSPPRWPG